MISWMVMVMRRLRGSGSFSCSVLVGIINIEPSCDEWARVYRLEEWFYSRENPARNSTGPPGRRRWRIRVPRVPLRSTLGYFRPLLRSGTPAWGVRRERSLFTVHPMVLGAGLGYSIA